MVSKNAEKSKSAREKRQRCTEEQREIEQERARAKRQRCTVEQREIEQERAAQTGEEILKNREK